MALAWVQPTFSTSLDMDVLSEEALYQLLKAIDRPRWHHSALCRGMGSSLFVNSSKAPVPTFIADLCARCPVKTDCEAQGQTETAGIWGGRKVDRRV